MMQTERPDAGPSSWSELELGARVGGRYRLLGSIGEGGMGHVYEAWDERESRMVAVKVMSAKWTGNAIARERFVREVEASRAVRHPNVVEVYDAGFLDEERQRPYLVMERLYGVSLWHLVHCRIQGQGPMDLELAVELMEQAADALRASHRVGVIHRDVKPENFHLTRGPLGASVLKLLDFGLVRIQHGERPDITRAGTFVGTPEYMAPELAEGGDGSRRTDVYGLASTFFELVTGKMPFEGETQREVIVEKRERPAPTLSAALPTRPFPPAMERVVARGLARDPAERQPDPHTFAVELRLAMQGKLEPETEPPAAPRRRWWMVAAALLLVAAAAVVALGALDAPVAAFSGR
jgi:serine/threonine protein kinase